VLKITPEIPKGFRRLVDWGLTTLSAQIGHIVPGFSQGILWQTQPNMVTTSK